jgi:hypothetical protein
VEPVLGDAVSVSVKEGSLIKFTTQQHEALQAETLERVWQHTLAKFATLEGSLRALQQERTSSKLEALVVTAWHCTQKQQPPRPSFTLRDIQQALQSLTLPSVGYLEVEQALDLGYIDILPDVHGMALTTDYTLTSAGENFVLSLLN